MTFPYQFAINAKYSLPPSQVATYGAFTLRVILLNEKQRVIDENTGGLGFGDNQFLVRMLKSEFDRVGIVARTNITIEGVNYSIQSIPAATIMGEITLPVAVKI
jgi:hypothetical protein